MLLRGQELAAENIIFPRNSICQSPAFSLSSFAASEIIKHVVVNDAVVKSLPENLVVILLKKAVTKRNYVQAKRIIHYFPHSTIDLFMIAKSCCGACYQEFVENIEEKIIFLVEAFVSEVLENNDKVKNLDAGSFLFDATKTKLFNVIEWARNTYKGTDKFKITLSIQLRCTCVIETLQKTYEAVFSAFERNKNSNILVLTLKLVFACGCSLNCQNLLGVLRVLPNELAHLYILNCPLDDHLGAVTRHLMNLKSLQTIDFECNHIGKNHSSGEMVYFGCAIGEQKCLRNLDLSHNFLCKKVELLLGHIDKGLVSLDLTGCKLDRSDMFFLASSKHMQTLTALNLSENDFSRSTEVLDYMLSEVSGTIRFLYLVNVRLEPLDLVKCAEILSSSPSLTIWDISSNLYEKSDIEDIFAHMAKVRTLKTLSLEWPQDTNEEDKRCFIRQSGEFLLKNGAQCVCILSGRLGKTTFDPRDFYKS
ncbi:hypothetical protein QYM36_000013 [Artemia franciscana]|uniref:Uncharacterized protein n=1 Tax=Artemia franciscana TaxID=6661 RepID=A0AA88LIU6_ARTSF|nr:hypothetical protein QYM36_000013 [Artemia franciscana]